MTDLRITQQTLEDQQVLLTIEVPDDRVEKALRSAAQRVAKQYRFPGFRPGKTPYHIILQRVGREALLEEAAEALRDEVYNEAIRSTDLTPYAPASLQDLTFDPLTYRVQVPLPPKVELGDYRSLRIPQEPIDETAAEQRVLEELERMASQNATWEPVERPIEYGDLVTLRLKLTVDGEVALENDDWDFSPSEKDYTMAPEFDAAFIGMSAGEGKSFSAAFPADSDSVWAGKDGQFDVEVKEVQGQKQAELNDELAKKVSGYETFAELRQSMSDHYLEHARDDAENTYSRTVLEAAVAQATLSYAPAAVDRTVDILISEQENLYQAYGFKDMAEVLRIQGRTPEQYVEEMRPEGEKRLRTELVLNAVADAEQFPVSDYEIDEYLKEGTAGDPASLDRMRAMVQGDPIAREYMSSKLRQRKARKLLVAIASGEDVPAPGSHVAAEPPTVEPAPAEEEAPVAAHAGEITESEAASQPETAVESTLTPAVDES